MQIQIDSQIDDQMAAAIMAAVEIVLSAEDRRAPETDESRSAWSTAGVLASQGLPGARGRVGWSTADRAGRAARWSNGVLASFHEW